MVTPSNSPGPPGWTNGGRDYWGVIEEEEEELDIKWLLLQNFIQWDMGQEFVMKHKDALEQEKASKQSS